MYIITIKTFNNFYFIDDDVIINFFEYFIIILKFNFEILCSTGVVVTEIISKHLKKYLASKIKYEFLMSCQTL